MTKYNMTKVDKGAIRFVFVTRGRSKAFDQFEIDEFFSESTEVTEAKVTEAKVAFKIPDDRNRHIMFLKDLKMGLEFCEKKYGVTRDEIIVEANRVAPYLNPGV